jgi:hypothetical protein
MHEGSRSLLFYREHIIENLREWNTDRLKPHKAMNLALSLNQMADYFFLEFGADPGRVLGATSLEKFREALRAMSTEFALVHDVADSHKHLHLRGKHRIVTNASQATVGAMRWDDAVWDETEWDGAEEMVITLNDGSKRSLEAVVRKTLEMWSAMFRAVGVTPPNISLERTREG